MNQIFSSFFLFCRSEVPHRRTQSAGDTPGGGGGGGGGVTVITIGTDTPDAGGILPAVLRDKPRISATPGTVT